MRILLTGGTGQIGGALLGLLSSIHDVIAPPRSEFDLSAPETLRATLDTFKPDLMINPAAYTAVDKAEDERDQALKINAEAPVLLARWAAIHRVPLIHFSTDYVFDGSGERPWREDDICAPLSVYGSSKWEGEKGIRSSGAAHLIIRTSWVYAACGTNFLRTVSRLARDQEELRVVADQYGAPTSARCVAQAVSTIINGTQLTGGLTKKFAEAKGLLHLVNAGHTSWHGFACAILDGLRARKQAVKAKRIRPITATDFRSRAPRPANSRLDLSRASQVFGIQMPRWELALERELDLLAGPR